MFDVLVIGGGNAALCAALMAREAGASVLLLEAAPRAWRGGNSQHTRNLRCMHDAPQDVLIETYEALVIEPTWRKHCERYECPTALKVWWTTRPWSSIAPPRAMYRRSASSARRPARS